MEKTLSRASLLIVLLVATLTGCGQSIERFGGPTMGSSYTVQYVPTGKAPDAAKLKAEVDMILASLDEQFSTYRDDSVVSRFNALPAGACMALPADMLKLWRYGEELSQQSGGAFDLSVEPLMNLWASARSRVASRYRLRPICSVNAPVLAISICVCKASSCARTSTRSWTSTASSPVTRWIRSVHG